MDEEGEINVEVVVVLVDVVVVVVEEEEVQKVVVEDVQFVGEVDEKEGVVVMLDGEKVEDEFEFDVLNYQILLGKIDDMFDCLKLDVQIRCWLYRKQKCNEVMIELCR